MTFALEMGWKVRDNSHGIRIGRGQAKMESTSDDRLPGVPDTSLEFGGICPCR